MSQAVNGGSLRHVVDIKEKTGTPTGSMGAPASALSVKYAAVRGAFYPLRGDQYFAGQQMASILDGKWRIRYNRGIRAGMYVYWTEEDRTFKIVSPPIDPEGRHVYLDLMVREIIGSES